MDVPFEATPFTLPKLRLPASPPDLPLAVGCHTSSNLGSCCKFLEGQAMRVVFCFPSLEGRCGRPDSRFFLFMSHASMARCLLPPGGSVAKF